MRVVDALEVFSAGSCECRIKATRCKYQMLASMVRSFKGKRKEKKKENLKLTWPP
jgi:hypothetical protein